MTAFGGMLRHSQTLLMGFRNSWTSGCATPTYGFATSAEARLGLNKPKRPSPAFLKFLSQVRPTLLSKNPGVSAVGIVKLASKHWSQLSEDAKSKMNKEYEAELIEYKKKKEAFTNSLTEEQKESILKMKEEMMENKEKRRMKAELKDLGRPKRPMTSFLLFMQSQKDKMKGKNLTETASLVAEKWRTMTPQEKSVYEKKAQVLHDAYQKELSQWEQKMIRMGNIDYVRNKALMPGDSKPKKSHSE